MKPDPKKVAQAMEDTRWLNSCERLRVAEMLINFVTVSCEPLSEPVVCVAQGKLEVAEQAVEEARSSIDGMYDDDLPERD